MRGRHSAGASTARPKAVQAVRAVLAVASSGVIATGVIVAVLTTRGSGAPGSAATPSALPPASAGQVAAAAAGPARPTRKVPADPFGSAATSYVTTRAGTITAAVYDVGTGQTWRLGTGAPQDEASVVKLDVLEALLAERGGGLSASDQSLAQQMIEDSDNDAATSLWYEVGGPAKIRSFNAEAGLTRTSPSPCVVCAGFPWPGWGLSTTVPADQIVLLRELVTPGSLLTAAERHYALSLMENVTPSQRWGVCGGVPARVTVALKNGWLPLDGSETDWQINSVGWISGQGRDYLMAVLTTGNPSEQYGIDTVSRLGAFVWAAMK